MNCRRAAMRTRINDLQIKARILAATGVLFALLLALGAYSFVALTHWSADFQALSQRVVPHQRSVVQTYNDLNKIQRKVSRYVAWSTNGVTGGRLDSLRAEIALDIDQLSAALTKLAGSSVPIDRAETDLLQSAWQNYLLSAKDALDVATGDPSMGTLMLGAADDDFEVLAKQLRDILDGTDAISQRSFAALIGDMGRAELLLGASAFAGLLVTFLIALVVVKSIVEPIRSITATMNQVAIGETPEPLDAYGRNDEIGQMMNAISLFQARTKRDTALISARERDLREQNQRFDAALNNMSHGVCMFDDSARVIVANDRYRKLYELPEELTKPGATLSKILEYRTAHGNYYCPAVPEGEARSRDPTEIQELGNGRVIRISRRQMEGGGWLTTHEDITDRRHNELRVAYMAHHDALTGLANRAAFIEKIADACARYSQKGEAFNVFILDLDRFKQVNDTLGHPAGDALLQQVAARLRSTLREADSLARLGGDEFAIIQTAGANPREAAQSLATRIIQRITEPFSIDGNDVLIGTSIGIALAPEHGSNSEDLIKMADLGLYHTKSIGRNNYTFFDPSFGEAITARHGLENDLRRAIVQNEFELHYQPIVDTRTLKICGAEALVRWRHPQNGLIFPDAFISLAEETGLINPIGDWVLQAACTEAATWPSSIKVSVNLSAVQLRSSALMDLVMCVLVQSGLPPERLEFEITETALLENEADCLSKLRQLKNLGVTLALDDFGTGHSSLSNLTMFPFDKIKIDKSFTQNITKRADCAAIVTAVLALAQSLDIATTAEGVEREEQLQLLRVAGVSTVQGYLIKRPGPASELVFDLPFDEHDVLGAA